MNSPKPDDYYDVEVVEEKDKDGYMVFQKVIKDERDFLFYNPVHFASIGFPDAVITVVRNGTNQPLMKGGRYSNTEELSWPFRQFVYLIQRPESSNPKPVKLEEPKQESSEYNDDGIFRRWRDKKTDKSDDTNSNNPFSGVSGFLDKLKTTLTPQKNDTPPERKTVSTPNQHANKEDPNEDVIPETAEKKANVDENPDSLCEAKREVGFRRNAGVSPNSAPKAQEEEMRRSFPADEFEVKVIVKIPVLEEGEITDEMRMKMDQGSTNPSGWYKIGVRKIRMLSASSSGEERVGEESAGEERVGEESAGEEREREGTREAKYNNLAKYNNQAKKQ
jgi:hypothetical protein